jgi:glycosyltransferase involved in cell wall biosynthesis
MTETNIVPGRVSICIPHWEIKELMEICLRSIRKHSPKYDVEVIIVDNGSKDESIDWLRSLDWISLIERPEEGFHNFPHNVFTSWELGIRKASGEYFMTMHSDVFVKTDHWLDPFFREYSLGDDKTAAVGAWKLNLENPFFTFQKKIFHVIRTKIKSVFGKAKPYPWKQGHYPRDYCAMYRRDLILGHKITFRSIHRQGGGYSTARQIWDCGLNVRMIPVEEMYRHVVHVAHGTAAVAARRPRTGSRHENKAERRVYELFQKDWINELKSDISLDR